MGFAWSLSHSVRRGDLFPAAGRRPLGVAPGGSSESTPRGGPWRRAREEVGWFTTSHHTLPVAGLAEPVLLLHLSDVHLREDAPWVEELAVHLRALRPDLICITGDVVTRGWEVAAAARLLDALPPTRLGAWASMGNWEYWADARPDRWRPLLAEHGVHLLLDEWVDLGPLILAGTDDMLAGDPDLRAALGGRAPGQPTVVLSHSPALFPKLVGPDVGLVLSGHSHGGQVRLPLLGAAWVPRGTGPYVAGWYEESGSALFVSRGIGWSIAPLRMWCPPELALIQLVPAPGRSERTLR